jgi:tetratricopeptide (TPR) repeat protein
MAIERILIVDGDEANLLFFELLLRDMGIPYIFSSRSGAEGLELAEREHAQMLICAWELEHGMSGTLFVQKVKAKRRRKYMPCLIYSKRMKEEDIQLTRELGFQDILPMPFDKAVAREAIKSMMDRENSILPIEAKLRKIEGFLQIDRIDDALALATNDIFLQRPYYARACTLTAEIFLNKGNFPKAEELLDKAFGAEPDYYPAFQLKARFLSQQGKHQEAIDLLKTMTDKCPANLSTKLNLGNAYIGAKDYDAAKATFNQVMKIDEERQDAKDGLATIAVAQGDIPLAVQLISETENGYEIAKMLNNIAIAQVNSGEHEKGIKTYSDAITILTDKINIAKLQYNLALAFKKKGELLQCWHRLAACYITEPSFEKAYQMLAKVTQTLKESSTSLPKDVIVKVKEVRTAYQKANPQGVIIDSDGTKKAAS